MSDETNNPVNEAISAVRAGLENEHVYFEIDGVPQKVVRMTGREKVSELYGFDLECESKSADQKPFDMLGDRCEMWLHDGFGVRRSIQGIISEAHRTVHDDGTAKLHVHMVPNVFPLTLSRDSRVFIDKTVPQIVELVLQKMPDMTRIPFRWELTRDYRERVYTAQYREADWTFISRLLEEEGIYYWFDHEPDESVIVFSDDSIHAPKIMGEAPIEFALETGMLGKRELIHEFAQEAHATATKFTVGSFDPWNPAVKVMATYGDGIHEMYDAPGGGPEESSVCEHIARNRHECAMSHRRSSSGNSSSVRLVPGRIVDMFGHPLHDGSYLVTEVVYDVRQRRRFEAIEGGFECHFEAIDAGVVFRPPEDTPVSKQAGIQSGRVVGPPGEEIHTDDRGRVRVQLHWDREGGWDDKAGKWMRVAQRGVGMSMLYPRIGWNVMTFMEEGNVDAPTVLSRVHDAEHPPTYPLPENKTKTVYRTLTSPGGGPANEIRYEDLAGLQEMFINAARNMNYVSKKDFLQQVGRNHEKKVGGDQKVDIKTFLTKDVKNDQKTKVGGTEELEVTSDYIKDVGGNETRTVETDRKLEIGSNHKHNVQKDRTLTAKSDAREEAREGLIKVSSATAKVTIKVNAKHTVTGIYQEQVTKSSQKTVKANYYETCKERYTVEVNGEFIEKLGANLKMSTEQYFMDASDDTNKWTVQDYIRATTKQLHVEAKKRILVKCGSSTIEITPEDIIIRSPNYDLSQSRSTVANTKQIKHN
jgi:type VI secretion system secreted protein VgrG